MASAGRLAAFDTPNVRRVLAGAAVLGLALGIQTLVLHLSTDPLADVHAYYDAGARLNAGLPLYDQPATTNDNEFYRYPPLLAIAFRPLALLPFEVAAAIWEAFLVACLALTIVRLGAESPDMDRPRDARPADLVEPRDRPGAGRRHAAHGPRARRGPSRSPRISRSFRRSPRSGGSAGATSARSGCSSPGWLGSASCSSSSSRLGRWRFRRRSGWSRSATSRIGRSMRIRRSRGPWRSWRASSWPGAWPRRATAGWRRWRCPSWRRRGC